MRRRSALLAFVLVLAVVSIGPGAILADGTRPDVTTIGQDGLTLYDFTFELHNEIPWAAYEATMTVYVLEGTFVFYAENLTESEVKVKLPPGSLCLEIRDRGEQYPNEPNHYLFDTPSQECVQANGGGPCLDVCVVSPLNNGPDDTRAVILQAGTVLYLPADTECFICAIATATDGIAQLAVTVRSGDEEGSWMPVADQASEATPESGAGSTPAAFRLGKLPMKNPGGCAGRF